MTASFTRCCASAFERALRGLLALGLVIVFASAAFADAQVRYAEIVASEDGYVVNADIDVELNPRLVEAVMRGVALHFATEFVIERRRWYWFDEVVAERRLAYRLSYHAITRSYRLTVGNLHQNFDSLEAALLAMQRVRNWHIVESEGLEAGVSYNASLRFRLDTSMLPKPFQVTAIGSRDWNLATDWMRWTFLAGTTR